MSVLSARKIETLRTLILLVFVVLGVFVYLKIKPKGTQEIEGTLTSSGEVRSYLIYIPETYDENIPVPLVITLHGYSGLPRRISSVSRWNDLADEEGFIAAYPQGSGDPTYWHSSGTTYAPKSSQVDVQFISDLIKQLEAEYNLDPARIYVNGVSMGGGMSFVLACNLANRIAAIGGVAGAYSYPLDLCSPIRPVPFIAFHGTADEAVPYEGEEIDSYGFSYPDIPQFMEDLAKQNQCAESTVTPQEGEISITSYIHCAQNADVTLYTIHGGGHTWPGDPSGIISETGGTTQQIDATLLMWDFFKLHPMPTE